MNRKFKVVVFMFIMVLIFFEPQFNVQGANSVVARRTDSKIIVNGEEKMFTAYDIGGNNYIKIRDAACAVNSTNKQFSISWDDRKNAINLFSSKKYTVLGGELEISKTYCGDRVAVKSNSRVYLNGTGVSLNVYNIDGNNYFKLRDIVEIFNIGITWDKDKNTILLNTKNNYVSDENLLGKVSLLSSKELSAKEIYSNCSSSIFFIETYNYKGEFLASGSGFFIDSEGTAVTNYHVIEDAFSAKVLLSDGKSYGINGILGYSIEDDIAVIKVSGSGYNFLKKGTSVNIGGGEKIYTIGSPLGLSNTISEGVVSNPYRNIYGHRLIQISAPISNGSSGGALINGFGEVIGVTSSTIVDGQNLNFAIPIETLNNIEKSNNIKSFAQTAKEYDTYLYENRSKPFDYITYEKEPNNLISDAEFIGNGQSIFGYMDDSYLDTFLINCNTKGIVKISCFSDSKNFYDLGMVVADIEESSNVGGEFQKLKDGSMALYLETHINRPGVYTVNLYSNELYKTVNPDIRYSFYYEFEPE